MILLLTILYLIIGFILSLSVAMILRPKSSGGLPDWENITITILAGLFWPVTIIFFICFGIYNRIKGN